MYWWGLRAIVTLLQHLRELEGALGTYASSLPTFLMALEDLQKIPFVCVYSLQIFLNMSDIGEKNNRKFEEPQHFSKLTIIYDSIHHRLRDTVLANTKTYQNNHSYVKRRGRIAASPRLLRTKQ